jgi:hypothetical protein
MTKNLLSYSVLMLLFSELSLAGCVLKMGYKEGSKRPLIAEEGNNSGVYNELFGLAAKRIGCRLVILRSSKKRIHKLLRQGYVDFYPGASFSFERSTYLQYIENGLTTAEYGITPIGIEHIESYEQVKKLGLIWLMELGSSKREISDRLAIKIQQTQNVDIDKVMLYFETRNVSFYVIDKEVVDFFTLDRPDYFLEYNGLKLHKNCCGGELPMYLGFSKKSSHYHNVANPLFNHVKALSSENQTDKLASNSIAAQFSRALIALKNEGVTQQLYTKHLRLN